MMTGNRSYILLLFLCFLSLSLVSGEIAAQQQQKKNKGRQTVIDARVTDENGVPVEHAVITAQEGAVSTYSGADGGFVLKTLINSVFMIQANGYEDKVIHPERGEVADVYTLEKRPLFSSSRDEISLPMGINITKRSTVGAISSIKGEALESYPDLVFSNALQGKIAGLTVRQRAGGLGNNSPSLIVRGLSRGGADGALTVVDGIERPISSLNPAEIEHIEVLKDATSKLLYGARAANGVILVTTKRGKTNTRVIKASTEYGTMMTTRMPEFINSYEYAGFYNEARVNDGRPPFYTDSDIAGYQQSLGVNDQRYPDVDYYDYFLKNSMPFKRSTLEFSGGDDQTQYALVLGYAGGSGLEKIRTPTNDRFNLRGNLDLEITPSLKIITGGAGILNVNNSPDLFTGEVFSRLSSHRPNEYPFLIMNEQLEEATEEIGAPSVPPLGGSFEHPDNLYGRLMYGGSQTDQSFTGQINFGLDLKLDKIVNGLAAKAYFTFDNYQFFRRGQTEDPITYGQRWFQTPDGEDTVAYNNLQKRNLQADQVRKSHSISRNTGWVGNMNYNNTTGDHNIAADLSYFYFRDESSNRLQDIENTNLSLRGTYAFKSKYYFEGSLAYMGSNRFAPENRYNLSSAAGVAWVLSEEDFLKTSAAVNFLKLKGNFGILGYDRATDFYLFNNRWYDNGNIGFNERNQNNILRSSIDLIGNPELEWEKAREMNFGVEGLAFNQRLQFEFNYFDELRYDIIINPTSLYTGLHGGLLPFTNFGETSNKGLEGAVNWRQSIGDLQIQIGGNFIYSKNKILKTNEILHPDEYLRQTGMPSDAIFGYVSEGLFTDQSQVDTHDPQIFGNYGPGDIAYTDLNNDNVIDSNDREMIGNNFPRTTLGIDMDLTYKGFGLYVLGTSELGVNQMLNNSYYWNYGEGKYSAMVRDRWHAVDNPDGTYPRLTTTNGDNNFRGSTFWLEDASFLRLKNVELSYTITKASDFAKSYRFYVRGTNLLVLSKIKDLDPEVVNAGVTDYPVLRTITGGVSFKF
jgi:TonB-linked SusC/RagA family outer membrane protein